MPETSGASYNAKRIARCFSSIKQVPYSRAGLVSGDMPGPRDHLVISLLATPFFYVILLLLLSFYEDFMRGRNGFEFCCVQPFYGYQMSLLVSRDLKP